MLKRLSCNEESLGKRPGFKYYQKKFKLPDGKITSFTYRGFSSAEAKKYLSLSEGTDRQNYVLKTVFLEDFDWNTLPDGNKDLLELSVLKVSGLSDPNIIKDKALEWLDSADGKLEVLTILTFPSLTLEYLENCDPLCYQKYCFAAIQVSARNGIGVKEFLGITELEEKNEPKEIKNPSIPVLTEDQRKEANRRMTFS